MQVSEPCKCTIRRGFCAFLSLLCTEIRQICGRVLHDFAERWSCGQAPFSFEYGSCSPLVAFGQSRYLPHGFGKAVCAALPPTRKSWPKGVARITLSGDPPRSSHIRFELVGTNDLTSNRVNRHKVQTFAAQSHFVSAPAESWFALLRRSKLRVLQFTLLPRANKKSEDCDASRKASDSNRR
jgi:hypothetical protein